MDYYESGYSILEWLQQWHHPILDGFFSVVSALGLKEFYLIAIPLALWCVDKKFGIQLCFIFLFGILLNTWAKVFFGTHRPEAARVRVVFPSSGGGNAFPSGHAQGTTAFWGFSLLRARKRWFTVFSVLFILTTCYSRLYLGLHFPWDVLGGIGFGVISLIIFFVLLRCYERIKSKIPWPGWIALIVATTALLLWLLPGHRFGMIIGAFLGFFSGAVLEARFVGFEVRHDVSTQIKKAVLGLGVAALLLFVCDKIGASGVWPVYALAAMWVSLGAPWVFKRLGWG